jgi:hypothetical protein
LLVAGMVLGIGMSAYAVDIKVYTEEWSGAKYDYQQNITSHDDLEAWNNTYDVSNDIFGFELVARRFYFNAENGFNGKVKNSMGDQDLEISDFKFGCRVVRNDFCTFDIFNGLLIVDGIKDYSDDDDVFVSLTLGGNLNIYLGDYLRLQGCIEVPLAGEVYAYNTKACLLLTPNFGLTVGYRGYKIVDDEEDGAYTYEDWNYVYHNYDESSTSKLNGLTMGIELNF